MAVIPFVLNGEAPGEPEQKRAGYRRAQRQVRKNAKHEKRSGNNKKDEKKRNNRLSRKQVRDLKKDKNLVRDLLSIISSFFPDLISSFKDAGDGRNKKYIKYSVDVILVVRILSAVLSYDSQRSMTSGLNNSNAIKNIAAFLRRDYLDELPHGDTINDCFKKMNPECMESFIQKMIARLLRRNTFNESRIFGDWQILVDATGFFHSNKRHCEHCLFSRHKGKDGEVVRVEYYHHVLEAKLVLNGNMVFSIQSEFIENEEPIPSEEVLRSREYSEPSKDKVKQDSEIKAFRRLAKKLKAAFPKLPICITADALYPSKGMFETCQKMGWHFIMRFKDGVIPALAKQFRAQVETHPEQLAHDTGNGVECTFATGLAYESFTINAVELTDKSVAYPFWFITDYPVSKSLSIRVAEHGRRRWSIENQGFKRQKKHGYHLEHMFSKDYTAMKIHYFIIQIAHAISQLWEHNMDMKTLRYTIKELHEELRISFVTASLTAIDTGFAYMRKRVRLVKLAA